MIYNIYYIIILWWLSILICSWIFSSSNSCIQHQNPKLEIIKNTYEGLICWWTWLILECFCKIHPLCYLTDSPLPLCHPASQSGPQVATKSCHAVSVALRFSEFEPLRFRCCRKGTYQSHTVIPPCHSHTHQVLCKYLTDGWMTLWKTIVETIPFEESWYILAPPLRSPNFAPGSAKKVSASSSWFKGWGHITWLHGKHVLTHVTRLFLLKRYAVYMHVILAFLWYSDHIVATNYDPIFAYL